MRDESNEKKSSWLVFAANQRMAAEQPRLAARDLFQAFLLEPAREAKRRNSEIVFACLSSGRHRPEAFKAAVQKCSRQSMVMPSFRCWPRISPSRSKIASMRSPGWRNRAGSSPDNLVLIERIVRLQVSMGHVSESLARAAQLRPSLVPGSDRHRLIARIYDWNAQPDEALALWLSFARQRADKEAETRAFALAQSKPDHEALLELLETVMPRRTLTGAEADAYVKAGLECRATFPRGSAIAQSCRTFQQSARNRKGAGRCAGSPRQAAGGADVATGQPAGRTGSRDWRWRGYMRKPETCKGVSTYCCGITIRPIRRMLKSIGFCWQRLLRSLGKDAYADKAYEKALASVPTTLKYLKICSVWRRVIAMIKKANVRALRMGSSKARRRSAAAHAFFLEAEKLARAGPLALAGRRNASSTRQRWPRRPITGTFTRCAKWPVETGMRPVMSLRQILRCGARIRKLPRR